jgi:hypothetical protein
MTLKMLVLVLGLVACGPNSAEIKTAKTTTYQMAGTDLLQLAEQAAKEEYKIGAVNQPELSFITQPRFYGPEGDLQSPGAGNFVQMQDRTIQLAFIVQVTELAGGDSAVTVTPKTFQVISGSPKPRELAPDDPNLPGFVHGRADQLALDIYELAKSHAYKH